MNQPTLFDDVMVVWLAAIAPVVVGFVPARLLHGEAAWREPLAWCEAWFFGGLILALGSGLTAVVSEDVFQVWPHAAAIAAAGWISFRRHRDLQEDVPHRLPSFGRHTASLVIAALFAFLVVPWSEALDRLEILERERLVMDRLHQVAEIRSGGGWSPSLTGPTASMAPWLPLWVHMIEGQLDAFGSPRLRLPALLAWPVLMIASFAVLMRRRGFLFAIPAIAALALVTPAVMNRGLASSDALLALGVLIAVAAALDADRRGFVARAATIGLGLAAALITHPAGIFPVALALMLAIPLAWIHRATLAGTGRGRRARLALSVPPLLAFGWLQYERGGYGFLTGAWSTDAEHRAIDLGTWLRDPTSGGWMLVVLPLVLMLGTRDRSAFTRPAGLVLLLALGAQVLLLRDRGLAVDWALQEPLAGFAWTLMPAACLIMAEHLPRPRSRSS